MRKIYDPMEFQPGMQQIDSDIFDRVIAARRHTSRNNTQLGR